MPSYAITGANRGIGYGLLKQISGNPDNIVIGLVRDVKAAEAKAGELQRNNVRFVKFDLDKYEILKQAAEETSKITGGNLDVLIANAALLPVESNFLTFSQLGKDPVALEEEIMSACKSNIVGHLHLFNLFTPLILKGQIKKVVSISTGMADNQYIADFNIDISGPYAVGKAGQNIVVAKFSAEYASKGVLFMSISPGVVDTGHFDPAKLEPEQLAAVGALSAKFASYAPDFAGPITPEESAKAIISVFENCSLEKGDAGTFLSHLGTKKWL